MILGSLAITAFGVVVLSLMMLAYALEDKHPRYVLAFALLCLLSALYGFLSGVWPFGALECIWSMVALRRWYRGNRDAQPG